MHEGGSRTGGTVACLHDLNAVLGCRRAGSPQIVDDQAGRPRYGPGADHQAIGGRIVTGQHTVHAQQAVFADIVALDGKTAQGIATLGKVERSGVTHRCALPWAKRCDHALA